MQTLALILLFVLTAKAQLKMSIRDNVFDCASIVDADGLSYDPQKMLDPPHCSFTTCHNEKGESGLLYFSKTRSPQPHFIKLSPIGNEQIILDQVKIMEGEHLLYEDKNVPSQLSDKMKKEIENTSDDLFSPEMYYPEKVKKRQSFFEFYSDPRFFSMIEYQVKYCQSDQVKDQFRKIKNLRHELDQAFAEMEVTQLMMVVDDILSSEFIPMSIAPKVGCFFNGILYTPKAFKKRHERDAYEPLAPSLQKSVTLAKANELFLRAKKMKDIPFEYRDDGCYARAHVMAKRFEAMGVFTQKAWIQGQIKVPGGQNDSWNFHVAPVIFVQESVDSPPIKYIIDPSIASSAIPLTEWRKMLVPEVLGETIETIFPFPENAKLVQRTAIAISSSDAYLIGDGPKLSAKEKMRNALLKLKQISDQIK